MTADITFIKSQNDSGPPGRDQPVLQPLSREIWARKYRLVDHHDRVVDQTPDDSLQRVAAALAAQEDPGKREEWQERFLWALRNGAIPAGRILANAGAGALKPATSTINCTVSATIPDSMAGIMDAAKEAALTLQAGSGIGYDFSTLRPKGAFVAGVGAASSGPLSFMDIFDRICQTVSAAGGRRGAQMAVMDIRHPDIRDFITAKQADGRLRQFNLSVLVTADFMDAVKQDSDWSLLFPVTGSEWATSRIDEKDPALVWTDWPGTGEGYRRDNKGRVACRVYETLPARTLWHLVMTSTWDYAEPGFILIDQVNAENNCWFCEDIRATNPCGEQPLPPHGACLLGSVNLAAFVDAPFTDAARFDWERFTSVVGIFTRMLDNVVEINGLPLAAQREEILAKRRHGMGFLGLGTTLSLLGMRYGDSASLEFARKVAQEMALAGWRAGLALAKEKGMAPALMKEYVITPTMLRQRPSLGDAGMKVGQNMRGLELMMNHSQYFQRIAAVLSDEELSEMRLYGLRFTHHTSIAPTGTISLSMANNASNGIEPSFAHHYFRNVLVPGKKSKEQQDVWSLEAMIWRSVYGDKAAFPDHMVSSRNISANDHLAMQAAVQPWIDSAISKTVNIPGEAVFDDFGQLYMRAAAEGLKGCTTYRHNPDVYSGVLVDPEQQAATVYVFTQEDGREIQATGDEDIDYDGQIHKAANLFEALKDGYYGKM